MLLHVLRFARWLDGWRAHAWPSRLAYGLLAGGLLVVGAGLAGCDDPRGPGPGVAEGQFQAVVQGVVADTLRGPARLRLDSEGRLAGIELSVDGPGSPGLTFDLQPAPLARRTYDVLDPEVLMVARDSTARGVAAYLETERGAFASTRGRLRLTYRHGRAMGGTFDLQMEGRLEGAPQHVVTATVTGALHAIPLDE
jgi:hypothetical protein